MDLSISVRDSHGVAVLELAGRLVYGRECEALREQVKQLLAADQKKILLNLKNISQFDSAGLGSLAGIFISVRNHGGELKLAHPTRRIQAVLESTSLTAIFDAYQNEEEALASFD
ncbi:MAG: STAS domain-containing protein [Terriglobia bacterium]